MPLDTMPAEMLQRAQDRFMRAKAYKRLFSGDGTADDAERVLRDLFQFCNVAAPVVVPGDALLTGEGDGRRRVALRIASFIHMSEGDMLRLALETETDREGDHAR